MRALTQWREKVHVHTHHLIRNLSPPFPDGRGPPRLFSWVRRFLLFLFPFRRQGFSQCFRPRAFLRFRVPRGPLGLLSFPLKKRGVRGLRALFVGFRCPDASLVPLPLPCINSHQFCGQGRVLAGANFTLFRDWGAVPWCDSDCRCSCTSLRHCAEISEDPSGLVFSARGRPMQLCPWLGARERQWVFIVPVPAHF